MAAEQTWEEIDRNKLLMPGDTIRLHFHSVGLLYLKAAQIAAIERKLAGNAHWRIMNWEAPDANRIIFTVNIIKNNPIWMTPAIIAVAIMGVCFMAWLLLDKVEQLVEKPAGRIIAIGAGALGIAAMLAIVMSIFGSKK